MDENFNSLIRFKNYRINNIFFKLNNNYKGEKESRIDTKFAINHAFLSEKKDQVEVTIACELFNDNFQGSEVPFYLNVSITGEFDLNSDIAQKDNASDELIEDIMKANTLAILFPYMRSAITSITAVANINPVILPPVNTNRLIQAKQ